MKNLCRLKGGSCNCLQKSTWGEGGSKSPKTGLRSLWQRFMDGTIHVCCHFHPSGGDDLTCFMVVKYVSM